VSLLHEHFAQHSFHRTCRGKPGRVRTAYLFGFNSTEKFEKVRDAYPTNFQHWPNFVLNRSAVIMRFCFFSFTGPRPVSFIVERLLSGFYLPFPRNSCASYWHIAAIHFLILRKYQHQSESGFIDARSNPGFYTCSRSWCFRLEPLFRFSAGRR
jgi:hypothetical protein